MCICSPWLFISSTTMNFEQFIEFADGIHEIRQKFAVINGKHEESNGRTN